MDEKRNGVIAPQWLVNCPRWISEAESLVPKLHYEEIHPTSAVSITPDVTAFQGWAVSDATDIDLANLSNVAMGKGDSVTLDFAEHRVGYLRLKLECDQWYNDSPVRLRLVFGEVPAEVVEPFDPYPGRLSRAWLQDVQIDIDELPAEVRLPRRYAFRFLRIDVVATSLDFRVTIADIACETVTSAGPDLGKIPLDGIDQELDRVSVHTLRQCMQTVFEDGPKRDRRLWIGDLRLQALANYVSFKDYDLVKRCLLLHAGLARREDGVVPACIYERPVPVIGHNFILDYAAMFGPTLLDYANASGDKALARDLLPVALHQLDYCLDFVDPKTGLFRDPGDQWLFLDWHPELHKTAGLHAILVYSTRRTGELLRLLGDEEQASRLELTADRMAAAARENLRDRDTGLYVSGPDRQVSWATQVWMVLAGVPRDSKEAAALFDTLDKTVEAVRPAGPYLWHHVVDALYTCGRDVQALGVLRTYWGAMVKHGATTFWEVFKPEEERLSPYGSHLVNSYCHAWSCTPTYFLRTIGNADKMSESNWDSGSPVRVRVRGVG